MSSRFVQHAFMGSESAHKVNNILNLEIKHWSFYEHVIFDNYIGSMNQHMSSTGLGLLKFQICFLGA